MGESGHGPTLRQLHASRTHVPLRELLAHALIGNCPLTVYREEAGQIQQVVYVGPPNNEPTGEALVHQCGQRHAPTPTHAAQAVRVGNADVTEEDLIEVTGTGHL